MRFKIFISSVQSEFASERKSLASYIRQDALLGRFFDVFIFEETPACNVSPQGIFLREVESADIYLGIFGLRYGSRDTNGVSPTEREYDAATAAKRHRMIYVSDDPAELREDEERLLIAKAEASVSRKNFSDFESLRTAVYTSLVRFLESKGKIISDAFDIAKNRGFTMSDLDIGQFNRFVLAARRKKKVKLPDGLSFEDLLKMLDAIDADGNVSNAAVLLFGKAPHTHFLSSEVKCIQFWGDEVAKPLPSYRIFTGTLIEQIEAALDFVLSRIDNRVGTRTVHGTAEVPTEFELPEDAVKEAIVNAVCHRDYLENGAVQVMLFRNRLEILNPGTLPKGWTVQTLLEGHKSKPRNESIALALHMAGYVEKAGTGTRDIVAQCISKKLKSPEYSPDGEDFSLTIWRADKSSSSTKGIDLIAGPMIGPMTGPMTKSTTTDVSRESLEITILRVLSSAPKTKELIASEAGCSLKSGSFKRLFRRLLDDDLIQMTHPDAPRRHGQQYCLSSKATKLLASKK